MEVAAKGTLLCGDTRALVPRFQPEIFTSAPHLWVSENTKLCSQKPPPLVQVGYALIEEAESCAGSSVQCRISAEIPVKGSKPFPAPASGVSLGIPGAESQEEVEHQNRNIPCRSTLAGLHSVFPAGFSCSMCIG